MCWEKGKRSCADSHLRITTARRWSRWSRGYCWTARPSGRSRSSPRGRTVPSPSTRRTWTETATPIFEGGLPAAAAVGTYTLRVLDSVMDLAGNVLDGDGVGGPGGDYEVSFSVLLNGDANGDGSVGGPDYTIWADHYLQAGGWAEGDFNGDGLVTGADYTLWADHYEESVGGLASRVPAESGPPARAGSPSALPVPAAAMSWRAGAFEPIADPIAAPEGELNATAAAWAPQIVRRGRAGNGLTNPAGEDFLSAARPMPLRDRSAPSRPAPSDLVNLLELPNLAPLPRAT